mmetsp:Transcript_10814/g.15838  ORF Transcript_10814/g.15838 Transcript_10814/m.15838 type:complete len:813 (+) Transcript_10814:38-2476(+)
MKEKELERNRKYKKKHSPSHTDDEESIDSIMSSLLNSNKQQSTIFEDLEYQDKKKEKPKTNDIIRDLLLDLNLPTAGEESHSPNDDAEDSLEFKLVEDDEDIYDKNNKQRSNHEMIQTDEFTMVLGNLDDDQGFESDSFLSEPSYTESFRSPMDSKRDFISALSLKHVAPSQTSLGEDPDSWSYEEDGYDDSKAYSKRIQQKWASDAKKRELDFLKTTTSDHESDTKKRKKKKKETKKKRGRKPKKLSEEDEKLIKNVEYTVGDVTLAENVMPELDMALELGVNQEELAELLPKRRKKREKDDDLDNRAVKKVKTTGEQQLVCCIKGCTKEVTNRLRFSLRCKEDNDYKEDFIEQHWDKVCHYHYFSDLYQYKKKSQKNGDVDDMDLMQDDVVEKEEKMKKPKTKKSEKTKKRRKKEKVVEADDEDYQPTPPSKRRKRSTKKKDKKEKKNALLEKELKEVKAELMRAQKKVEEERKKRLEMEKEEKKKRKVKAKKEKKELKKKKKSTTKKKDVILTKIDIAQPSVPLKEEPGLDNKKKLQQHTGKMHLQSIPNKLLPNKTPSLQITQHLPNGMQQATTMMNTTNPTMHFSTPLNHTSGMSSTTMPMNQSMMHHPSPHPLTPYISNLPHTLLKAKVLVEDQKRQIYIQRYQIDRQVKYLKKQETTIQKKQSNGDTSDELKRLQSSYTSNQTHLKNQNKQLDTMRDHLINFKKHLQGQYQTWMTSLSDAIQRLKQQNSTQYTQYRSISHATPQYLSQLEVSHRSLVNQLVAYHDKQKENFSKWNNFVKPRSKDEVDKLFKEHEASLKQNKRKAS